MHQAGVSSKDNTTSADGQIPNLRDKTPHPKQTVRHRNWCLASKTIANDSILRNNGPVSQQCVHHTPETSIPKSLWISTASHRRLLNPTDVVGKTQEAFTHNSQSDAESELICRQHQRTIRLILVFRSHRRVSRHHEGGIRVGEEDTCVCSATRASIQGRTLNVSRASMENALHDGSITYHCYYKLDQTERSSALFSIDRIIDRGLGAARWREQRLSLIRT